MARRPDPPLGVRAISTIVAFNAVTAIVQGYEHLTVNQIAAGIVVLVVGAALLHRAYFIWQLRRHAYRITILLLGLRAVLALVALLTDPFTSVSAISLIVAAGALLYLTQPNVRSLFR